MGNVRLKFCGAAQTVTGSSHLIELPNGKKVLLDCGLYQGNDDDMETFNREFLYDPKEIDAVVLSHAHIDHAGRIPKLVKDGFEGKIITTHATRDLCTIMLMDSAFLQVRGAKYENKWRLKKGKNPIEPLYDEKDVRKALTMFMSIGYDRWYPIPGLDSIWLQFRDSGHILGSGSVTLRIKADEYRPEFTLGFTGDIGRPDRPILRDPKPMPQCDFVICESTYGDRLHTERDKEAKDLLEVVQQTCIEKKGKLIIPAFSVGRTQEIVYMFDQLANQGKLPRIPIYVDSPLAINATEIFRMHPDCFDEELVEYMMKDPNPFGFNDLHYIKKVDDSKRLNELKEPCVIISASGMITGGRIKHHVFNNIENPKNTILIVGYAAPHTIGGQLRNGNKEISMFGSKLQVRADVKIMSSFSAHGDYNEMIDFLDNQDRDHLKKLFLVHGELKTQEAFKGRLKEAGFKSVQIPHLGQEYVI